MEVENPMLQGRFEERLRIVYQTKDLESRAVPFPAVTASFFKKTGGSFAIPYCNIVLKERAKVRTEIGNKKG